MAVNALTSFANREVMDLVFVDYNTKTPILNWPLANATTTSVTGEVVHAYGGAGRPKRVAFYGDKTGTLVLETQMQSYALYSIMTGGSITNAADFLEREVITCTVDGELPLKATPKGDVNVFAENDDCGTPVVGVTVTGNTAKASSIVKNSTYIVYYIKEFTTGVTNIRISADTFPKATTIYGTTVSRTEDDQIVAQKLIAYKASPQLQAEWSFSNSGDPATLSVTFDLMADEQDRVLDLITLEE